MLKKRCVFVNGFCKECGKFKGLNKRQSNYYGKGLDCFWGSDITWERLNKIHLKAMRIKLSKQKWLV